MTRNLFSAARIAAAVSVLLIALPETSAAQRRNREPGDSGGGSQAVPRERAPEPPPQPAAPPPAPPPPPAAAPESNRPGGRTGPRIVSPDDSNAGSSQGARPREGRRVVGTAVPRGSVPRPPTSTVVVPVYRGYWPWGYSGLGFGSYYGRYYDPYVFYDPYGPWYGYGGYGGGYRSSAYGIADGSLRLKVRPRDAQVYVDGYYAGVVDEFDGVFQRLHLEAGPHQIEIRAPGFETLTFDVQIRWDDTTTFEGELKRNP